MAMKRFAPLLIVLLACGALRGWLICNTDAIAEDGTTYVSMARQLSSGPRQVAQSRDYHIGYPAVMAAAHRVLLAAGAPDSLRTWEVSGQVVSLVASLAAIVAVWLLAGMAFLA